MLTQTLVRNPFNNIAALSSHSNRRHFDTVSFRASVSTLTLCTLPLKCLGISFFSMFNFTGAYEWSLFLSIIVVTGPFLLGMQPPPQALGFRSKKQIRFSKNKRLQLSIGAIAFASSYLNLNFIQFHVLSSTLFDCQSVLSSGMAYSINISTTPHKLCLLIFSPV